MKTPLEDTFERLKECPFPEFAEDDALADWQADLGEWDAHVAGIASTILSGGKWDATGLTKHIDQFRRRLETIGEIGPEDQQILLACLDYLSLIEEVIQSMKR